MREILGRTLYRIRQYSAAGVALQSIDEYVVHREEFLSKRRAGLPGQRLLCWSHVQGVGDELIPLTNAIAKHAGTSVPSLRKAYPSEWYVVGVDGVFVRFPEEIRYGADLPEFRYYEAA